MTKTRSDGPDHQHSPIQNAQQLQQEIRRLQSALAARQQDGRPLSHCVVAAYKTQIARCEAAQAAHAAPNTE